MATTPLGWKLAVISDHSLTVRLFLIGVLWLWIPAASALTIEIDGAPKALAENVRLLLGQPASKSNRALQRFAERAPEQARTALAALGYYAAQVEVRLEAPPEAPAQTPARKPAKQTQKPGAKAGKDTSAEPTPPGPVLRLTIIPGDPVRTGMLDLGIAGAAREDPAFMPVFAKMPLQPGRIFLSSDYEATKALLLDRAQDLGYFNFEFTTATARVSRRSLSADITLQADSGPRYTFGPIQFDQDIFTDTFLERWTPFETGDPFSTDLVAELTQNLQHSGYFKSVRVVPQRDRRYGTTVPVKISLLRKDDNQVGIGIGVSTDTGVRTKLSWEKPLINRRGHSAEFEAGLSQRQQDVAFSYRIPRRNQPLTNYWSLEYGLLNNDDDNSLLSTLNFQRVQRSSNDWIQSLFVRWERERWESDAGTRETDLVMPGISYNRSRSRGQPFLEWGQNVLFQLQYGSKEVLSSIDFFKSVVKFRYLNQIVDRNTLILSLQYGAISSNDFDQVPPSQRFFAGGDQSIRGYQFRSLGPQDAAGDVVGGRYLEVATLEYNYRLYDRWSLATFVDAGRAFDNFSQRYNVGAGVGVRWSSPVGPFRLDLARDISEDDPGLRAHLSIGAEFQ